MEFEVNDRGGDGTGCYGKSRYSKVNEYDNTSIWKMMKFGLKKWGLHQKIKAKVECRLDNTDQCCVFLQVVV